MASRKKSPSLTHQERAITLRDDGGLRIALVADTHSDPHPQSLHVIAARKPDVILHAGDIGDLAVLESLATIAKVIAVRGNIDERLVELPDAITLDVRTPGAHGQSALKILLMHIAVYGPKIRADAAQLARQSGATLILCGHSHVPFLGRDRGLTVFNPGSIGPRRFLLPIVFGFIEIADGKMTMEHVSCETGTRWMPGGEARAD